jgi:hypothetical protein
MPLPAHRTLGATALASALERAGLRWRVEDPGIRDLAFWRACLERARTAPPRCVGISTTFITSAEWLEALCAIVRRTLPGSKIVVGGYYYGTNARRFLSLDADVCCVGEGEARLPAIVRAIRDGGSLDRIPGLYIRGPDGALHFTGNADNLDLNHLPPVDWRLAERIDPPVDLDRDRLEFTVETQRGCVFKCEFCTYRTLAAPSMMAPSRAVDAILETRVAPRGFTSLADATATFPHPRWRRLLELLVERGGSPYPLWCYARVNDLDDQVVELMARAGVRHVFIGQESGDQRMLNLMRKGTRVDQVRPAVARLARHRITADMAIIHGFPGEDSRSLHASRHLLATINDDTRDRPVVSFCAIQGFLVQDLAAVSQQENLKGLSHHFAYDALPFTARQTAEATLETKIQLARIPHAPIWWCLPKPPSNFIALSSSPEFPRMFRWLKALNLGVALFLERDLAGTPCDPRELARVRELLLEPMPPLRAPRWRTARDRAAARAHRWLLGRLIAECSAERETGSPGPATRLSLARATGAAHGRLDLALRALRRGEFVTSDRPAAPPPATVDEMASELIELSLQRGRVAKLPRAPAGDAVARAGTR